MAKPRLKVIPLGGLGEIGKNMTVLECEGDIIVVDCGLMFPEEEMLGIDLVIPDISYLIENKDRVRGIVITHGHEDHIGALPYVLRELNVPVFGTKLTLGLISVKLKEHRFKEKTRLRVFKPGVKFPIGCFKVEMLPVCHSIPDSVALVIRTPAGIVVHSGDFKLDYTPVDGKVTNLSRMAELGNEGVLLLMSDSTYAELPGYTPSESVVGETLDRIISQAKGRVIITTFSSLISRVQQIVDSADKYGRNVAIIGRSLKDSVKISTELGYLNVPSGVLCRVEDLRHLPHDKVILLTTGSQGEPTSALVRIANRESEIRIQHGDTVVMSATPVPGNEALVNRTIDDLFRQGAKVIYSKLAQVHVHGHGSQEELKLLLTLIRPKFFVPIHGEYRHLSLHADLAKSIGMPEDNVFIIQDGDILELTHDSAKRDGKLSIGNVYVDGLTVGNLDSVVLRDRKLLSRDGMVVVIIPFDKQHGTLVGHPEVVSRGFVDNETEKQLLDKGLEVVESVLGKHVTEPGAIQPRVKDALARFFYEETRRRPVILPVIMEL